LGKLVSPIICVGQFNHQNYLGTRCKPNSLSERLIADPVPTEPEEVVPEKAIEEIPRGTMDVKQKKTIAEALALKE
jgi:hypothetical protein